MLLRIGWVEGMKSGGEDWMAGNVKSPIIEGDPPWVGIGIASKGCETVFAGAK